ncbi:hypothetical protein SAMN05421863_10179 [Nitrosomonas communis]|jgi:hypothetical protein|uniref:Uncharacterized protein n=1 Tax=Nitrosomonas communis TaxID=44574 RepID=A0A1I4NXX9_9PROT|nr:hypothetical protein SAMN05421863_10179 [Nitrosomonas communis]
MELRAPLKIHISSQYVVVLASLFITLIFRGALKIKSSSVNLYQIKRHKSFNRRNFIRVVLGVNVQDIMVL